jgi:hypothetical protein
MQEKQVISQENFIQVDRIKNRDVAVKNNLKQWNSVFPLRSSRWSWNRLSRKPLAHLFVHILISFLDSAISRPQRVLIVGTFPSEIGPKIILLLEKFLLSQFDQIYTLCAVLVSFKLHSFNPHLQIFRIVSLWFRWTCRGRRWIKLIKRMKMKVTVVWKLEWIKHILETYKIELHIGKKLLD